MGSFFSKSISQSGYISGNHNIIWIHNGAVFDISSVLNQTIHDTIKQFEKIVVANNASIMVNFMMALTIVVLLMIFLHLRIRCQESLLKTASTGSSPIIPDQSLTPRDRSSSSKDSARHITGYVV